jgi:hypothetical protein
MLVSFILNTFAPLKNAHNTAMQKKIQINKKEAKLTKQ